MVKMNYAARTLMSFLSFNIGWWACALGASHDHPWLGPAVLPLFVGLHLYYSPTRKGECLFLILLGAIGFVIDTIFIHVGLFKLSPDGLLAPPWLIGTWILLGQTYESMLMMRKTPALLALSGGFSGPFAYYCFEALDILEYRRPLWISLALHAVFWAAATFALFVVRDWCLKLFPVAPTVLVGQPVPTDWVAAPPLPADQTASPPTSQAAHPATSSRPGKS